MNARIAPALLGPAACLVAGALAWFAFGAGPAPVVPLDEAAEGWVPVEGYQPDLQQSDVAWATRRPWGAVATPDPDEEAPAPSAYPVGTTRTAGGLRAVFLAPDGSTVRLQAGDDLPGGGRVDAVSEATVSWTDPQGEGHERRLLADPLPSQANYP